MGVALNRAILADRSLGARLTIQEFNSVGATVYPDGLLEELCLRTFPGERVMSTTTIQWNRLAGHFVSVLVVALLLPLVGCQDTLPLGDDPLTEEVESNDVSNSGLTGKFVGAKTCITCHSRHYDNWQGTAHASAMETLEAIGQDENPVCLGCHTVGYGLEGGFVNRATTDALAGVQCENCHGAAKDHATDVTNVSKRPIVSMSSAVCADCHTGSHHPTADEWAASHHAGLDEYVAGYFADGRMLNSCGPCHSGDFRLAKMEADKRGETVPDDLLAGMSAEEMNPVTCAVCHNPHMRTANAVAPAEGRDYQLRFAEVVHPAPANSVAEATDPDRFNLCGQCHHSRGKTWEATSRGPHGSLQANVYAGEMPVPDGTALLVANERTIHAFVPKQCATCHMAKKEYESEEAPAITGHAFSMDTAGCVASGCHTSQESVIADLDALQTTVASRLDGIATRLGDVSTWEYTSGGGPDAAGQALLSDAIKQIRFLYYYVANDGSLGVHNPQYVDSMLDKAETLLTSLGM